ncbi:hypothetical protein WKI68_02790 [Streptomyces sp. MS1.HAVA.3]|uniref:Uncharacterized protein n=1 Tax=Streptomyces caledonius TaxID=3134107 RepID=A0ABU8TYI6_9ACTN
MGDVHAECGGPPQQRNAELVVADDGEQGGPCPGRGRGGRGVEGVPGVGDAGRGAVGGLVQGGARVDLDQDLAEHEDVVGVVGVV